MSVYIFRYCSTWRHYTCLLWREKCFLDQDHVSWQSRYRSWREGTLGCLLYIVAPKFYSPFFYSLFYQLWRLEMNFDCLLFYVECPNVSTGGVRVLFPLKTVEKVLQIDKEITFNRSLVINILSLFTFIFYYRTWIQIFGK